jgi:hypothetical protein
MEPAQVKCTKSVFLVSPTQHQQLLYRRFITNQLLVYRFKSLIGITRNWSRKPRFDVNQIDGWLSVTAKNNQGSHRRLINKTMEHFL